MVREATAGVSTAEERAKEEQEKKDRLYTDRKINPNRRGSRDVVVPLRVLQQLRGAHLALPLAARVADCEGGTEAGEEGGRRRWKRGVGRDVVAFDLIPRRRAGRDVSCVGDVLRPEVFGLLRRDVRDTVEIVRVVVGSSEGDGGIGGGGVRMGAEKRPDCAKEG